MPSLLYRFLPSPKNEERRRGLYANLQWREKFQSSPVHLVSRATHFPSQLVFVLLVLFFLCRPLLFLPPVPPSIRVFSNESALSFSFSIIPSKKIPGLISFRMDWLDLLAVQGTLKSLLQHHSSKASILRCSAFFTVQLSHPYMTTGKTIALTRRTLVAFYKWTWIRNLNMSTLVFCKRIL